MNMGPNPESSYLNVSAVHREQLPGFLHSLEGVISLLFEHRPWSGLHECLRNKFIVFSIIVFSSIPSATSRFSASVGQYHLGGIAFIRFGFRCGLVMINVMAPF